MNCTGKCEFTNTKIMWTNYKKHVEHQNVANNRNKSALFRTENSKVYIPEFYIQLAKIDCLYRSEDFLRFLKKAELEKKKIIVNLGKLG